MSVHELQEHLEGRRVPALAKAVLVLCAVAALYLFVVALSPDVPWSASAATSRSVAAPSSATGAPKTFEPSRGFEYFPDKYQLQAKEPAEPMATF